MKIDEASISFGYEYYMQNLSSLQVGNQVCFDYQWGEDQTSLEGRVLSIEFLVHEVKVFVKREEPLRVLEEGA